MGCGCMETSAWEDACRTWIHGDPGCGCRETPGYGVKMQWMRMETPGYGVWMHGDLCMGGCMQNMDTWRPRVRMQRDPWVWGEDAVDACMHGDRVRMQWMYGDSSWEWGVDAWRPLV